MAILGNKTIPPDPDPIIGVLPSTGKTGRLDRTEFLAEGQGLGRIMAATGHTHPVRMKGTNFTETILPEAAGMTTQALDLLPPEVMGVILSR